MTNTLNIMDCEYAFAVPNESSIIDCINPVTGKSWIEGESLEEIRLRYPGAEKVNIEEWSKAKAAIQDRKIEWIESNEERYYEMMECLPPAYYLKSLNVKGFLVGEPSDHHSTSGQPRFSAFIKKSDGFFESNRPLTVKEFKTLE